MHAELRFAIFQRCGAPHSLWLELELRNRRLTARCRVLSWRGWRRCSLADVEELLRAGKLRFASEEHRRAAERLLGLVKRGHATKEELVALLPAFPTNRIWRM